MSYYLTQGMHRALRHHPERLATVSGATRHSFVQFADRVARLAAALRSTGVQPGDRVAMLALNSHRYLEYYLGVFWAGAVACPINVRWTADEIAYGLKAGEIETLIVDDSYAGLVPGLRTRHDRQWRRERVLDQYRERALTARRGGRLHRDRRAHDKWGERVHAVVVTHPVSL